MTPGPGIHDSGRMTDDQPLPADVRIFLGWDSPALPEAARVLAERYRAAGGMDLRAVVVVTPAARAARRLVELLLEEADARGMPLTPPRTVTIGQLPELLYRARRPPADPATVRHAFSRALQDMDAGALEGVFRTLPRTLSGWAALAGTVAALHRETGAEGMDFREVARAFRRGFPYDDSPRWEVLATVQDRYAELLQGAGLGDVERERRRALEEERILSPGEVWLVGVVEMPKVVRRMVEALPGGVRALVHAPGELRDTFDSLGCVVPARWESARIPLAEERIRVVPRPPDQADAAAWAIRGFGGRFSPEEVVVGVPDPEIVPYVERGLAMAGVPHRFAGGTRLEDTGPLRLLRALAEYLDGRSYPAFGALIRHPDLHEVLEESETGEEVTGPLTTTDRYQADHLQASVADPLPGEESVARRTRTLVGHLEKALALDGMTGTRPLSGWMPPVLDVLARVYGGEPLDTTRRGVRRMLEAILRIRSAATRLASLPRVLDQEVRASEALGVLLADLRGEAIPPDPEEHAVELLGWLELPLDDAPAVVLTGMNDGRIPESMGPDPFLPGSLRSHLGMPDDRARYARDAYLLSALVHSREEVDLVVGRLSASGDPLRPSRLLFACSDEEVARRVRWILGQEAGSAGAPAALAGPSAGRSRFRSPPEDPIRISEPPSRIRVTDFGILLTDPYGYALKRILNLESLEDDAREMDGRAFGNLAHLVLERFGRSPEASSTEVEVVEKKLSRLLDGAVHEIFGRRPVPAVRVQAEQLRVRLRAFARWQAAWAGEGWRIVGVEAQPQGGVPFEVDGEPIQLRGKIDRIDHNPTTGEWAIFDYKTGEGGDKPERVHRRKRGSEMVWVDLQLPLYRRLLAGILTEDDTPLVPEEARGRLKLGYILLPRALESVGMEEASWSEAELAEAEEEAREMVRRLRAGVFHYDPDSVGYYDEAFDALLGRMELRVADEDEDGGGEA